MTVDKHTHELARPVPRGRHPEPGRVRGHLPAAGGAARPLHGARLARLPERRRRRARCCSTTPSATACSTSSRWPRWARCWPRRPPPAAVHGSEALRRYVVAVLDATRADPRVDLGASPRAGLMLFRAAKAHGRARRARPRAARRRPGARRRRCSPTACCWRPGSGSEERAARGPRRAGPRPGAVSDAAARRRGLSVWALCLARRDVRRGLAVRARGRADRDRRRRDRRGSPLARAAAPSIERRAGPHTVVEEEPYPLRIEVRAGLLPPPGGELIEPLLGWPVPIAGRWSRRVRINVRFSRRGRRDARAGPAGRSATRCACSRASASTPGGDEVLVLPRIEPVTAPGGEGRRRRARRHGHRPGRDGPPPRRLAGRARDRRAAPVPRGRVRRRASTGRPSRGAARCSSGGSWPSSTRRR